MKQCMVCGHGTTEREQYCPICGYHLQTPKFLSRQQTEAWLAREIQPRRHRWQEKQKQLAEAKLQKETMEALQNQLTEMRRQIMDMQIQLTEIRTLLTEMQKLGSLSEQLAQLQQQLTAGMGQMKQIVSLVSTAEPVRQQKNTDEKHRDDKSKPTKAETTSHAPKQKFVQQPRAKAADSHKSQPAAQDKPKQEEQRVYHVPKRTKRIEDFAFSQHAELREIFIPDTVTYIGSFAFRECTKLEKIHLSEGLQYIGSYAFAYCQSLKRLDLPKSLQSIGDKAFLGCSKLEEIHLSGKISNINKDAFAGLCARIYYPAQFAGEAWIGKKSYGGKLTWIREYIG